MRHLRLSCAILLVAAFAGAKADELFDVTFSDIGGPFSGEFILTGHLVGTDTFLIDSGSGTVFNNGNPDSIATLIGNPNGNGAPTNSPSGFFTYDDLLYYPAGAGASIDNWGLLFNLYNGTTNIEFNLYGNGAGQFYTDYLNTGFNTPADVTVRDLGATPEPFTMALGISAVGLAVRRKLGSAKRN